MVKSNQYFKKINCGQFVKAKALLTLFLQA